jgi:hypothetical protein
MSEELELKVCELCGSKPRLHYRVMECDDGYEYCTAIVCCPLHNDTVYIQMKNRRESGSEEDYAVVRKATRLWNQRGER